MIRAGSLFTKRPKFNLDSLIRLGIGIAVLGFLVLTILAVKKPYLETLREGDVSLDNAYAPYDFFYPGAIDEEKTNLLRQEAVSHVDHIFDLKSGELQKLKQEINAFLKKLTQVRQSQNISDSEKLAALKQELNLSLSEDSLTAFLQTDQIELLLSTAAQITDQLLVLFIISPEDKEILLKNNRDDIIIRDSILKTEQRIPVDTLLISEEVKKNIWQLISTSFSEDRRLRNAFLELVQPGFETNLIFNEAETNLRQEKAQKDVPAQYKLLEVKKNELIVEKGQRINKIHLVQLKQLSAARVKVDRLSLFLGISILTIIFIILTTTYLKFYEPKLLANNKDLFLVGLTAILLVVIAKLIIGSSASSYFIPIAIASMLIGLLLSPRLGLVITIMLSMLIGMMAGDKVGVAISSLAGGAVGVYAIRKLRRRSQLLRAGLMVGIAHFFSILGFGLVSNLAPRAYMVDGAWGLANGLSSGIIVAGILPVFEHLFNITTNISLLELSDLNHPLLKEMIIKAPGTYHHSLIVGNLAEAACEMIGANSLSARLGAYFHDIGKLEKPEYFSENQTYVGSKHDTLFPTLSGLVITNHVRYGLDLAKKYRLKRDICDFIRQHHGTGLVFYFYQKALEHVEDEKEIKEEKFRYPGPKPQTKETAVVLLADSVEAASRTLTSPTPSRIKSLVRRVINNKFIDGQLDECELTLKDLERIADTFTHVLIGIYHTRVEYSKKDENISGQSTEESTS